MKTTATHLFCTAAVVTSSSRCSAYVAVPSSFGVTLFNARHADMLAGRPCDLRVRGKKEYSLLGTRRPSTCVYSVPYLPNTEEEGDDGSFFLSASRQAANDRYELLKQGKDPLAMSLSTTSVKEEQKKKEQDIVEKEEVAVVNDLSSDSTDISIADAAPSLTLENDDYADLLSSLSESPMAQSLEEEKVDTQTITLDEIKRVEDEIAEVKSQLKDKFHKRLMDTSRIALDDTERVGEGSTAEEMEAARNARLVAAGQVIESNDKVEEDAEAAAVPTSTDSTSKIYAGEGSTAEEMEEARKARLAAADEIAKTLKKVESIVATAPEEKKEEDETKIDPEVETMAASSPAPSAPQNASQTKLSSDGKVIYEPSQAALDINQENVDNGLMVLTRSFLVLNSIVQRLDEDKK